MAAAAAEVLDQHWTCSGFLFLLPFDLFFTLVLKFKFNKGSCYTLLEAIGAFQLFNSITNAAEGLDAHFNSNLECRPMERVQSRARRIKLAHRQSAHTQFHLRVPNLNRINLYISACCCTRVNSVTRTMSFSLFP